MLRFFSTLFMFTWISGIFSTEIRTFDHGVNLNTTAPLIIAHRGSCGIFPEHTLVGYQSAIDQGADVIECDLSLTKDHQFVCLHECWLENSTNVAHISKFSSLKRTYNVSLDDVAIIQYMNITNWFSVDFKLAEIKELRKIQSMEGRDHNYDNKYEIATLEELIALIKSKSRKIGLHLETKQSFWVNSLPFMANTSMEELLVQTLNKHGYTHKTDPCFLQSFSETSLLMLKNMTELPLVRLFDDQTKNITDAVLERWSTLYYGIGPWKDLIAPHYDSKHGFKNTIGSPSTLLSKALKLGFRVHAYTFRNEDKYLAWNFHQDPVEEYKYYIDLGVSGFFTDFPSTMTRYVHSVYKDEPNCPLSDSDYATTPTFVLVVLSALVHSLILR